LGANVLAIDYRGFAESTGTPSEDGLAIDARAAWDWLISNGAKAEDILIMGHSLGTGVSGRLAASLSSEEVPYRGVVLMSPFSSILSLLSTYHIGGVVPLMKPLSMIPFGTGMIVVGLQRTAKPESLSAFSFDYKYSDIRPAMAGRWGNLEASRYTIIDCCACVDDLWCLGRIT
jgi:acetyl esterase/lipase